MNPFWSDTVARLVPYVPGEQPQEAHFIKLNTNENPYGPSPKALEAIHGAANASLRLYPDPESGALKAALGARFGLQPQQVFVGNGSDEVLAHAFAALLKHEQPVWFADVSYSFYPTYCALYGMGYRQIPLAADFSVCVQDYCAQDDGLRAGAIVLANPNAPTGRALPLADVRRIVSANPQCVVLVDEAYVDFGAESAVSLIASHPNVLVVHTFSKGRAFAGLRVAYALGDAGLIEAMDRVKNSFNSYPLDRLAQAAAVASLQDEAYWRQSCQQIIASREALTHAMRALGFDVLPSAANFVFARHHAHSGAQMAAALRQRGILVRHFAQPQRIASFVRITVGTPSQCESLLAALRAILAA